ncbi:hypothetical protein PSN01_06326 [Micromonospora saelicesensis]|nr:hypothetical protein PSN01_06326 [Micromonospora saelicesensis]
MPPGLIEQGEQGMGRPAGLDRGGLVELPGAVDVDDQRPGVAGVQLLAVVGRAQRADFLGVEQRDRQPDPRRAGGGKDSGGFQDYRDAAGVVRRAGLTQAGMVADAVVVGGQQHLGPTRRRCREPRVDVGAGHVAAAQRGVRAQPARTGGGGEDGAVGARVEGQDGQRSRVRAGEDRVLPAVGVDGPAQQQTGGALGVAGGVERVPARGHHQPPAGWVAAAGHTQRAAPDLRSVG